MKIPGWQLVCLLPAIVSAWKPRYLPRQAQSFQSLSSAANTCPVQYNVVSTLAPTVSLQPLAVQSSFASNTTFVASPYNATITVNNAPTSLDTTITAISTITQTVVRTYVTVSSDYAGTSASTTTIVDSAASSGAPQTVIVYYPRRFAVVTSFGTGSAPYTSTISPTASGQSGTIVVYQPPQYVTSTTIYAGTVVSTSTVTSPASPDQTGQLVVYQPGNFATTTVLYDGTATITSTQTPASSGGQTTLVVSVPRSYVTITSIYQGSATSLSTQFTPTQTGQVGTQVLLVPGNYATSTVLYDGTATITSTQTPATAGGQTTLIVSVPRTYVTITSIYQGSATSLSTQFTPTQTGQTGTQVLLVPGNYATTTVLYDGTATITSTQSPASSGGQTTLVVSVPRTYVTVTSIYQGSATSLSTQFTPTQTGQIGTQVLLVPGNYATTTVLYDGTAISTSTQTPASSGGQTTLVVNVPRTYVTLTSIYQGSATSLSTQFTPTVTGQTGTQVLLVPGNFVTSTVLYDGSSTSTVTQTPASSGGATTLLVQVPRTYSTVTTTYNGASTSLTTATQSVLTQPGTVYVQVPRQYTTITTVYDGTATLTSTQSYSGSASVGTVYVNVPRQYTTVTTTYAGTATVTSTSVTPSSPGQTGIVVVQVPQNLSTITTTIGIASAYTTTSTIPASGTASASPVVVVAVPARPFRILITDYTDPASNTLPNYIGYLEVSSGPTSGTSYSSTIVPYAQAGSFYIDSATNALVATPQAGANTVPLYSVQSTAIGSGNGIVLFDPSNKTSTLNSVTASYWPERTLRVTNTGNNNYLAYACNGTNGYTLWMGPGGPPAGCVQAVLSPIYDQQNYTSTTITTGTVTTSFTKAPTGSTVSSTGTVSFLTPAYSTITTSYGGQGFTSTSTISASGSAAASPIVVVGVPVRPFHILITDFATSNTNPLPNYYGYLDVSPTPQTAGGKAYNASVTPFAGSSLFYIDSATNRLALAPQSGVSSQVLYSEQLSGAAANSPFLFEADPSTNPAINATYWPERTLRVTNTLNGYYLASLCNGTLYLGLDNPPAGCTQAVLSPIYDQQNYTSTTTTSGLISTSFTKAPTGTTVSSTGTVTIVQPTSIYCNGVYGYNNNGTSVRTNAGLLWATWDQPWTVGGQIDTTYMGGVSDPYAWGQTPRIGVAVPGDNNWYQIYDDAGLDDLRLVNAMHTGYVFARTSGTYTFTSINPDDAIYLWVGPAAISGWNNNNANFSGFWPSTGQTFTTTLQAGTFTPFRLFWGNTGGVGGFGFTITNPAGAQLLNGTGSTDIVVQPCPGSGSSSSAVVVAPQCSGGLSWQLYNNPIPCPNSCAPDNTGYNTFNANYFNQNSSLLPISKGLTGTYEPSFSFSGNTALYGQPSRSYTPAALVYRAYFVPAASGIYRFSFNYYTSQADDIVYVWTDPNAINTWTGWSDSNEDLRATYFPATAANAAAVTMTYQFAATAGQYIPFTMLWANANLGGGMDLQTTHPNGTTTGVMAGLFLSPGCNVTQTAAPACSASGLAYAAYSHPFGTGSVTSDAYWLGFNASYFNPAPSATPLFSGVATNINLNYPTGAGTIYGQSQSRNLNRVGITYQGFFTVPVTGVYSIALDSVDDVGYIWMGGAVQNGNWGETNWQLRGTFNIQNPNTISQNFLANQLYPIAVLWANGDGGAQMRINITAPGGQIYTDTSGFFVQPSCAGQLPVAVTQPQPPTRCAGAAIEWSQRPYPTASGAYNPNNYSPPTASPYSTLKLSGIARDMSFGVANTQASNTLVYGQGPIDVTQSTTILRGYFIPNVTGIHTFNLGSPDDVGYMWIGNKSINSWTTSNADINGAAIGTAGAGVTNFVTYNFATLTPVPIRFAFGNAGGAMSYQLQVTPPGSTTAISNTWGFFQRPMCGPSPYSQWT